MKRVTILLTLISTFSFSQSEIVNISDTNFLNALISDYTDLNDDGKIQKSEAISKTNLSIVHSNIHSLQGIEEFTNLIYLDCSFNKIDSLNLSSNISLFSLIAHNNKIEYLNIDGLVSLSKLEVYNNNLTSFNSSGFINLTRLAVSSNQIESLDISNLAYLIDFSAQDNNLTNLILPKTSTLKTVVCNKNNLTELDVSGLRGLEELQCTHNEINHLDIDASVNLRILRCISTKLTSLDISSITNLIHFYCNSTPRLNFICVSSLQEAETRNNVIWFKDASTPYLENCSPLGVVDSVSNSSKVIKAYNLQGQEIPLDTKGEVIIILYDNGVREKTYVAE